MAADLNLQAVEQILDHRFEDQSLLVEALHAPGSGLGQLNDRSVLDGNRKLAQLGDAVMKTVILDGLYFSKDDRSAAQELLSRVGENQFLAQIARDNGIDTFVVVNRSQRGNAPSTVLLKAVVGAIVAAIWIDSRRDVLTIQALIKRLGYDPMCAFVVPS